MAARGPGPASPPREFARRIDPERAPLVQWAFEAYAGVVEKDLEGLLHISKVDKEAEQAGLAAGDVVEVRVVKLEPNEGKIGLSLSKVLEKAPVAKPATPPPAAPTA